jgi:peroxiredoxin
MIDIQTVDEYSYLKTGDILPDFSWKDENGKEFSSGILFGKYLLVIFFTNDCRHCRDNFAYLEKNLFGKKFSNLNILAFGRGCDSEQIETYAKIHQLSIKLTRDPDKAVYLKFAEKVIPRSYLFDTESKLILSIRGFRTNELNELIRIVKKS